ncbi:hypothetical protein COBT_001105 [Conglomerata obtusa]
MENNIFLSLRNEKTTHGISLYDQCNKRFILCHDFFDNMECDILKSIIYKLNVTVLLISLDLCTEKYKNLSEMNITIVLVDKNSFKIFKTTVVDNVAFELSLRSFNALITYLKRNNLDFIAIDMHDIQSNTIQMNKDDIYTKLGSIGNNEICIFEHNNYMYLNNECLKSLNVFNNKKHPNKMIKTKEDDNSLFSRINFTQTPNGAILLRKWMLFPLFDQFKIEKRRTKIEFIINKNLNSKLAILLSKCKAFNMQFTHKSPKTYFKNMLSLINNGLILCELLSAEIDKENLNLIATEIEETIMTLKSDEYIINQKIDYELDSYKDLYEKLPEYLDEVAKRVNKEYNIPIVIVYFPQIGYMIETKDIIKTLEPRFTIKDIFYYKNKFMEDLDEEIGDLRYKIKDTESKIVNNLLSKIEKHKYELCKLYETISIIDCYNSLATAAIKYNMINPKIITKAEKSIKLENFYNLTLMYKINNYKPLDINVTNTTVLTGKNGSGKSSYLRSIGIAVILNQIGSFLPCRNAEISLFDKLFTKLSSTESIIYKRSAFLSDILQLQNPINFGTINSLLLVDEFGKGTNVIDGASILFSIIGNLKFMLGIYSTHFQTFLKKDILQDCDFLQLGDKDFVAKHGLCEKNTLTTLLKDLNFDEDFIEVFTHIKSDISKKNEPNKENENEWAIKTINEFLSEFNST